MGTTNANSKRHPTCTDRDAHADSGNGDCNAKGDATGTQPDRFRGFAPGSDSYPSSKPHTNGDFKPTGVAEPDIDKILTRILAF